MRIARGRRDRRGRPVADGARGPGHDAGRARVDRALPVRRHQHGGAGGGDGADAGISYLRTTRGGYPGIYPAAEKFPVGGAKLVRSSEDDQVTLVGAGVTLHEALRAAEILAGEGIAARVIDCYSVKPVDARTLAAAATATAGGSWSRRTITRRAGSALPSRTRCSPRVSRTCGSPAWRSARSRVREPARNCSRGRGSTRTTSRRRRASWRAASPKARSSAPGARHLHGA